MKKLALILAAVAGLATSSAFAGTTVTGKVSTYSYSDGSGFYTIKLTATTGTMAACATTGTYLLNSTYGDNSAGLSGYTVVVMPLVPEMVLAAYNNGKTVAITGTGLCSNGQEIIKSVSLQ